MGETVDLNSSPDNAGVQPRAWRPGVALWLSAGVHVAAVIALFMKPRAWQWILAALVLNHVVLALIGLWPKSRSLGDNLLRLPDAAVNRNEISLTFDDGPDPDVTPQVLDILDAHHAKASFFVIGDKAAAHADLIREIVRRGHSIENHSCSHSNFYGFFAWTALLKDIGAAQEIIAGITGRAPAFFRSPMGIRNPLLDRVTRAWVCATSPGHGAASTPSPAILPPCWNASPEIFPRATSCCCTIAVSATGARWYSKSCPRCWRESPPPA